MGDHGHDFMIPADCGCGQPYCWICDAQLGACKVCGGLEGSLTTQCPEFRLTGAQCDAVYEGKIDFRYGAWIRPAPTRSDAVFGLVLVPIEVPGAALALKCARLWSIDPV